MSFAKENHIWGHRHQNSIRTSKNTMVNLRQKKLFLINVKRLTIGHQHMLYFGC